VISSEPSESLYTFQNTIDADSVLNSCYKNGMLPLQLPQEDLNNLYDDALSGEELAVDLENEQVIRPNGQPPVSFKIDAFRRHCLLNGLDDIGLTLQHKDLIEKFEEKRTDVWPWLDGIGYAKKGGKVVALPTRKEGKKMEW
jgi:3-isopropylmalate dehydratase